MAETDLAAFQARFQRLLELRQKRDLTATQAATAETEYKTAEAELYEALQDSGIRGRLTFDFGGDLGKASFQPRSTKFGRIIDQEQAIQALEDEGLTEVIYERSVRKKRLNELVRDRLESQDDLPDGIDFYENKGISISRK